MSDWYIMTKINESEVTSHWMAVEGSRVVWHGLGTDAMDVAYAIVSLNEFTPTTKVLMSGQYQQTVDTLKKYRDSKRQPSLPLGVVEQLD